MTAPPSPVLASVAWPELAGAPPLLAVPLGACEQHGPHLPLGTDTMVASALAGSLAARWRLPDGRPGVVVAPALPYGASGEHAGFAGTLSLGTAVLRSVLVELVRSADAFAGVVVVSAHGGNGDAVAAAVAQLHEEGRRVMAWAPSAASAAAATGRPADAHAGHVETSLLLHLAPELVRAGKAVAGATQPLAELLPRLRSSGVAGVSANGVLGDPAGASAADGRRILDAWTGELVDAVARWERTVARSS